MPHPRPFRFGIINERAHAPGVWTAQARRAENEGYATFLIRDHFIADPFGDQFAPIAALATAAAVTTRLRVGTLVIDNDYRHPVILAKEAATLDVLSDGRFELGLGAGWLRAEYEKAGMSFDTAGVRIGRLEEAIHVIKGLFGQAPLTFAGRHYAIDALSGFPKPVQRPHPPILVGGGSPRILRLAGRLADTVGILTASVATGVQVDDPAERLATRTLEKLAWVREGAGARFDELELSLVIAPLVTDDRGLRAEALIRERRWTGVTADDVLAMPSIFIGSVEQIVEAMLVRRTQYGFSYYVIADRQLDAFGPVVARLAGR